MSNADRELLDKVAANVAAHNMSKLETAVTKVSFVADLMAIATRFAPGQRLAVDHDGFCGVVIGYYITLEGKPGLVLQLDGAKVVHVYSEKWFQKKITITGSFQDSKTAFGFQLSSMRVAVLDMRDKNDIKHLQRLMVNAGKLQIDDPNELIGAEWVE